MPTCVFAYQTGRMIMKVMSGATIPFKLWCNYNVPVPRPLSQTEMKRYTEQKYILSLHWSVPTGQVTSLSMLFHSLMTSPCLHQTQSVCMCLFVWCKWTTTWKRPYLSVYLGFNHCGGEAVGERKVECERRISFPLILKGICISFTPHCKYNPPTTHTCHLINHLLGLQMAIVIQ